MCEALRRKKGGRKKEGLTGSSLLSKSQEISVNASSHEEQHILKIFVACHCLPLILNCARTHVCVEK